MREFVIAAGFSCLRATRVHRLGGGVFRGLGAVLMFHHVRPTPSTQLQFNRGLEVTPEFLAKTIETARELGFDLISLDQALARLCARQSERPFAVLTFDDGYRDNLEWAEPVLTRLNAPYTFYITTGFTDGAVHAWWSDMEEAILRLDRIQLRLGGAEIDLPSATAEEKDRAANLLASRLFEAPGREARAAAESLLAQAGVEASRRHTFITWRELRALARSPLCTIGAHTLTHPRLACLDRVRARREIAESRGRIAAEIGREVRHLAYPYGGPTAAGPREFAIAAELGFASAVTTRPGMLFPEHAAHVHALPRLSVNGAWQKRSAIEALLSGLPFAVWNRGRRVIAG